MQRRELLIRMASGEELYARGSVYVLGSNTAAKRNYVTDSFVRQLVDDGLAEITRSGQRIRVGLTAKVDDWFERRGIRFNLMSMKN